LIGAGYWGKNLARNFLKLGALHSLCDANAATLAGYGADYAAVRKTAATADLFQDPAVAKVAIAAPAVQHYALAKAALEAGKDVFVEKPLCLDLKEARELVALAEAKKRILMVGHLLQYHPCVRRLQELVAQGGIGTLQYVSSTRLNLGKIRREENALWSFAPHDISVILSLVGDTLPEQVRCSGEAYLSAGVHDTTMTVMRFPRKVRAHVHVSWLNPFKEQKLTVVGSSAMAVFDDTLPWAQKLALFSRHLTWTEGQPIPAKVAAEHVAVPESEPLADECAHFLECCRSRKAPRTDGPEGIRVLTVLRAAQASLDHDGEAMNAAELPESRDYFAHPTAVIDAGARIGKGTKIWHFSHVMPDCEIGEGCNLGQNVVVSPRVKLGKNVKVQNNVSVYTGVICEDNVFLGPSMVFTNVMNPRSEIVRKDEYKATVVRKGATIGANATIVCGTELGEYCFIGAGAVVTKDVKPYALMVGNPARQTGWMSRQGERLDLPLEGTAEVVCPRSQLRYRLAGSQLSAIDGRG